MKKEIAEKWVEALRSGNYAQTKLVLRDSNGFCCLGVLCDISGFVVWENDVSGTRMYADDQFRVLPDSVKRRTGMENASGEFQGGVLFQQSLSAMNDRGKTFAEIADIIENNYEYL